MKRSMNQQSFSVVLKKINELRHKKMLLHASSGRS